MAGRDARPWRSSWAFTAPPPPAKPSTSSPKRDPHNSPLRDKGIAKPRPVISDYPVSLVMRLFVCFVQAVSPRAARSLARGLAWLLYRIARRHREVARENLRHAFPCRLTFDEEDQLVRSV